MSVRLTDARVAIAVLQFNRVDLTRESRVTLRSLLGAISYSRGLVRSLFANLVRSPIRWLEM